MEPAILTNALTVRFGDAVAVDALTLEIAAGEIFALVGHNGAGKTTTIRALNGLLEPAGGTMRVLGLSPAADGPALRRRTAVLTESSTLDERLTARETLRISADLYGVPAHTAGARVDHLLADLGLLHRAGDRVAGFSKGMKQRLSLARALLHDPELLFLDEPAAGLDPAATRQLHALIRRLTAEERRTIVLCTHNLAEAQELGHRVGILARGRLLAVGTPTELARRTIPSAELILEVEPEQIAAALPIIESYDGLTARVTGEAGGGVITVGGAAREHTPALVARLAGAGIRIYRLVPREPSLADVYFALQPDVGERR